MMTTRVRAHEFFVPVLLGLIELCAATVNAENFHAGAPESHSSRPLVETTESKRPALSDVVSACTLTRPRGHDAALAPLPDRAPASDSVEACLQSVPKTQGGCLQTIETCVAETVDGGKTTIARLEISAGDACAAKTALQKQACARGIAPHRFLAGDIRCAAATTEAAESAAWIHSAN